MAVFVLDKKGKPLMPCSERRARVLLSRRRARIHKLYPFTIRLIDRLQQDSVLQPISCKIDPGSQVTGMALVRADENTDSVVTLIEIKHRGHQIRDALTARRAMRRARRQRQTRLNQYGFPRSYLMRSKFMHGFMTGDIIKAQVLTGKKTGTYQGRVAIRQSGYFNIQTKEGLVQGIHHRYCKVIQRADGYDYQLVA